MQNQTAVLLHIVYVYSTVTYTFYIEMEKQSIDYEVSSCLGVMLKADSFFSSLSKQLSCFMNPAMPSPGEPELSWQTNTPPLLLPCFHPYSSAYYSGDSDTKRHEERGPRVDKQRMPSHVTPAWTDALAGNWGSWRDGWEAQTHTYAQIHYIYTHKGMSPVIAFHLSLTGHGQAIAFRCPVLNT